MGGYVGYSCILFGDALRKAGGQRYYSLEMNPEFAAVIMALVDLAGLSDIVKVIIGRSSESLRRLKHDFNVHHIDLLFLDHHKPSYVLDLKICEFLKLVGPGTVLAADNVIKPGNPSYLEYVRSSVADKRSEAEKRSEERDQIMSGFLGVPAIEKRDGIITRGDGSIWCSGNPNLIYESRLVNSFEPTGIPVSTLRSRLRVWLTFHHRMAWRSHTASEMKLLHEREGNNRDNAASSAEQKFSIP